MIDARISPLLVVVAVMACAAAGGTALGQQDTGTPRQSPILEFPDLGPIRGSTDPPPLPGSLAPSMDLGGTSVNTPAVMGGKRRTGRLPRPGKQGAAASTIAANRGMQLPETLPAPAAPALPATLASTSIDATIIDDAGPPDGLTLDEAIDRMIRANLDVRALRHELSQADADILTAGLRTNPLVYMDSQFIPYRSFSNDRPGGPTQYDVNVTMPVDVSQKRHARTVVARMARSTLEAQFQDVTRRQIDNVYRAFVTLQAARIDLLAATSAVRRHEARLAELTREAGREPADDAREKIAQVDLALHRGRLALGDAAEACADAREGLGVLLSLSADEAARLEPRGGLRDRPAAWPGIEELESLALKCRPDLRAARLGVGRAGAELSLQRANRVDDVYLFYDPITIQDNSPFGRPSAASWAMGLTFALPIFNRNQGNIARAESNIGQSKLELASLERRVVSEVRLAERELARSREAAEQIERSILPRAAEMLARRREQLAAGEIDLDQFETTIEDVAEVTQSHRDAVVRHRRAQLELNTAVGLRILP